MSSARRASGGPASSGRATGQPEAVTARAGSATDLATLLRLADGGTRTRVASEIQARHGNKGLVSLLGGGTRIHGLPAHVHAGFASEIVGDVMSSIGDFFETEEEADDTAAKPIPTTSGTTIKVSDTTFSVAGDFASMAANLAGRTEAGSVTSQISDIYMEPMTGKVKLANITVDETRSLPAWVDRGSPTTEQVAEWDRFRGALGSHEQQHIDIDTKFFTDLHAKAIGLTYEKANEKIDAVEAAATAANGEFDTKTDHGRNNGTKIDTNVGAGVVKVP